MLAMLTFLVDGKLHGSRQQKQGTNVKQNFRMSRWTLVQRSTEQAAPWSSYCCGLSLVLDNMYFS
jgi:hypothetical protein